MHAYVVTRGVEPWVRRWKENLEWNYCTRHKFGKKKIIPYDILPVAVRPVQLWEIVFPETSKKEILKKIGCCGYEKYSFLRKFVNFFSRMLGLEVVPIPKDSQCPQWVGVHLVGLKKDIYKNGIEQL